jgi:crotonobetainyl-CoA:carnitine CoA-transferase CaiB-like acyl-CoA transferase
VNPLLRDVLPALGLTKEYAAAHLDLPPGSALPATLPVGTLAHGSVAAAALSALALAGGEQARVDPRQVAASFRSDQLLRVDGRAQEGFAPMSGFFEAADGWVRTHANYPHHRVRLLRALDLADDATREDLAAAVAQWAAQDLEDAVAHDHGVAARVRTLREWMAGEQAAVVRQHRVLDVTRLDGPSATGGATPIAGGPAARRFRVLDLTRVIAGPVATRTLAFVGCDVLRVDSPHLAEIEALHLDGDAGKRSTLMDLHDEHARSTLHELLDAADAVVTGYRPGSLHAFGLDADQLAESHPHLVVATLSAWTPSGPWGGRRGFDSIVQAATGIAALESADGARPGALPAQALDHATGYLLAAGVLSALRRRGEEGGTWRVGAHLARTAHWLVQTDALDGPAAAIEDPGPWLADARTEYGPVRLPRPAFRLDDGPQEFAWVGRRWGSDEARWAEGAAQDGATRRGAAR